MPILNSKKRISPLDINKNVKIGVAFPLNQRNMFKGTETVAEQNKANLIMLLLTELGERVNEPNFGVGLQKLLFENNIDLEGIKQNISQQINIFIPMISLMDIKVSRGDGRHEHTIFIVISYKSKLNGEMDAIKLNFN